MPIPIRNYSEVIRTNLPIHNFCKKTGFTDRQFVLISYGRFTDTFTDFLIFSNYLGKALCWRGST